MFAFGDARPARRPSLTPMIDVVFLLLVFFMLVSRFGADTSLALATGGAGAAYRGPPRLVEVLPDGQRLNGVELDEAALLAGLAGLVSEPGDAVLLRPAGGATLQRLVDLMQALSAAGHARLVVVE